MSDEFVLSTQLHGHTADVRAVCVLDNGLICSASRDTTVRIWTPSGTGYELVKELHGHEHFVASLKAFSSSIFPGVILASGGHDKVINLWGLDSDQPLFTLLGHEGPIPTLSATSSGLLLSGSWDKTIRVWSGVNQPLVCQSHSEAVWAVVGLPNGQMLSGSADKTIKLWDGTQVLHTYIGHSDCVRSIVAIESGIGFLSCSNDCSIRMWAFSGECLREFYGHSSFIYTLSSIRSKFGNFASGGEDFTLKIWADSGDCVQTIKHTSSIWSIAESPNGDLVTGCADGIIRIWTRDKARAASADVVALFEQQLNHIEQQKAKQVGGMNVANLPGPEALSEPGKTDKQVKVIRNGNIPECYQWSQADKQWIKTGEVVDTVESGNNQMIEGKPYDYVFDVDIGDGYKRKLGYNKGENPYSVAQDFLWKHELNQGFLDQVANFIISNTQSFVIGQQQPTGPANYVDPFTGANRYVPGASSVPASSFVPSSSSAPSPSANFSDPFTGGNRYIAGQTQSTTQSQSQQPQQSQQQLPQQSIPQTPINNNNTKMFPVLVPLLFDTLNFDGPLKKLKEFNGVVPKEVALSDSEFEQLLRIVKTLQETSFYHSSTFSESSIRILSKLLKWPVTQLFPVIDILRSFVLHPDSLNSFPLDNSQQSILSLVLKLCFHETGTTDANKLLGLRCLTNMFKLRSFRELLIQQREEILETISETSSSQNKGIRLSLVSFLLNFSIHIKETEGILQIVSLLTEFLPNETDPETQFRALVTIGTVLTNVDQSASSDILAILDLSTIIEQFNHSSDERIKRVVSELKNTFLKS